MRDLAIRFIHLFATIPRLLGPGGARSAIRPFVERLIGTVRREFLDHVPFWSSRDLERKLLLYLEYYNRDRVHRGLNRATPNELHGISDRKIASLDDYRWEKRCHDLYRLPAAA